MSYQTMVKIKFDNEECFDSFCKLLQCKLLCFKGCEIIVCDNDDKEPLVSVTKSSKPSGEQGNDYAAAQRVWNEWWLSDESNDCSFVRYFQNRLNQQ
jgi:hypothetical protein